LLRESNPAMGKRATIGPSTEAPIQNAASIEALLLTTETVVADELKKAPAMPRGDGGMGGLDY